MRLPALITSDGHLDPETLGDVQLDPRYEAPSLSGHMVVQLRSDLETALTKELDQSGELDVINKSGHSRAMMTMDRQEGKPLEFESNRHVRVPVQIASLRGVEVRRNGTRDEVLSVLADMTRERRREVMVGRLALAQRSHALRKGEIMDALKNHTLLFDKGIDPEQAISDEGIIQLPLEKMQYLFCEENFDEDAMRRVIRFGKHGLEGVQDAIPTLPKEMRGRQAFVGGMRISIGPYTAILERETTAPQVEHLAARVLDGIRTSGIEHIRQVELFNQSMEAVPMEQILVQLRLYHATRDVQEFARSVMNRRTIHAGVSFADAIGLEQQPERLIRLLEELKPTHTKEAPYGFLVGAGKFREIDWMARPSFQDEHLMKVNAKFAASDPKYASIGKDIPHFARGLASTLRYVGREQTEGRLCASWGFPDPGVIARMRDEGTGVFIAHDLRTHEDAFDEKADTSANAQATPTNDMYFDEQLYNHFRRLSNEGVSFFLARHAAPDAFAKGEELPPEILEWHKKGMWVRPDQRERLEGIDTIIAMYGSHVAGTEDMLREQIIRFSLRMKQRFGSALAYIHGKGPGVMYIADNVAETLPELAKEYPEFATVIDEDIFRMGVGIDAERFGQAPNFHPPAQLDFRAKDRLTRQKVMNDISTMNIFNIGGAGTLEEIALTICSQKLLKNIPAPMIFVDPIGLAKDGGHLWQTLATLIEDLAEAKTISSQEAENGKQQIRLLQQYVPHFLHIVRSYDEAADIIEGFADDPTGYYLRTGMPREQVVHAFLESVDTFQETQFPMPSWLNLDRVCSDSRWNDAEKQDSACAKTPTE
jgi:hypothetical protein